MFKGIKIAICEMMAVVLVLTGCSTEALSDNSEVSAWKQTEIVSETDTTGNTQSDTQTDDGQHAQATLQSNAGPQDELLNNNSFVSLDAIPAYDGKAYVAVNDNVPFFTESELTTDAFEYYSELDSLGRCGVTYANVCKEIMPTEERGKIGSVKPSGWHTVKYDIVDGKYLYNRCHLIGYQLSGENANTRNLITGTRYLNIEGMLPFENMVADYVKETGNHVLYRVTPMFEGDNLVASGVLMEAESVEDNGAGILFNVYCYNVQPGVTINYANGESSLDGTDAQQSNGSNATANSTDNSVSAENNSANEAVTVHITRTGKKYHRTGCRYLKDSDSEITLDEAKSLGLSPCGVCNPPQ